MPKKKSYAYITCQKNESTEFLVFTQTGHSDAGMQIPGGTVDEGETPEQAIVREIAEETGIVDISSYNELGNAEYFHPQKQELYIRHFFSVTTSESLPKKWSHVVSSGTDDSGLEFNFFWIPLERAQELAGEQGIFASKISTI